MRDVAEHGGRLDPSYYIENGIGKELDSSYKNDSSLIQSEAQSINEPDRKEAENGEDVSN